MVKDSLHLGHHLVVLGEAVVVYYYPDGVHNMTTEALDLNSPSGRKS